MGGYTLKWDKQCGAYHKLASLQTNAATTNLHPLDIMKAPTLLVCGATNPNQSYSPLLLKILGSNLLIRLRLIIWFQASNKCTNSPKIGWAIYTVASRWNGITRTVPSTSPSRATSKRNCKNKSMWRKKIQICSYSPELKQFGTEAQAPLPPSNSPRLNIKGIKCAKKLVGSILYYAQAIDMVVLIREEVVT